MLFDQNGNAFFGFVIIRNRLLVLWPFIYVIVLIVLGIVIFYAHTLFEKINENIRTRKEEKKTREAEKWKAIISRNSKWYQDVLELNRETKYYADVFDNGHSVYFLYANSKTQYDRLCPDDALCDFLAIYREKVERALEQIYRNKVIYEVYDKKFRSLQSSATPQLCEELDVDYEEFINIERTVVRGCKLRIPHRYSATCVVEYISPQGRNHYSKDFVYCENEIRMMLKSMDKKKEYQQTEEFRRKSERSKLTPSLRYDILKRDGFRCRLCGRSANSGVELEVDHIVPLSKGGATIHSNLQTLCRDCNRGKGAKCNY